MYHEQRVWPNEVVIPFNGSSSMAGGDIVYLIAVFAMAVQGDGTFKPL